MSTKPILFSTDMVRAILDGRKTVTRRVVKTQHLRVLDSPYHKQHPETPDKVLLEKLCDPPYRPGDILYVRETWCWCPCWDCGMDTEEGCVDETAEKFYSAKKSEWGCYGYRASPNSDEVLYDKWHPSIHMPREAARIFLRVTDVQVERLQDITEEQARAEGTPPGYGYYNFGDIWDSTIKPADRTLYGWAANPWVWVIEFERISKEDAAHEPG